MWHTTHRATSLVAAVTLWCRQMVGRRAVARQTVGANIYWTGLLTKVSGADTASVTAVYDFGWWVKITDGWPLKRKIVYGNGQISICKIPIRKAPLTTTSPSVSSRRGHSSPSIRSALDSDCSGELG